jgi:hypothetical protein
METPDTKNKNNSENYNKSFYAKPKRKSYTQIHSNLNKSPLTSSIETRQCHQIITYGKKRCSRDNFR